MPLLFHVTFDGIVCQREVFCGISQSETGPGAVVPIFNGVDLRVSDWKPGRHMKVADKGFHAGYIIRAVHLQSCLVSTLSLC